jgi:hypothetical protein
MINNNTGKTTQKSTATISESSIYLKKSELPQNVSSFKNDAGYISSSALGAWLKEHAYISKTEITSLINKANLVVVDTVNKSADSEAINRLNQEITGIKGEIVEIKDILENINNTYVSSDRIKSLATKTDIANLSDEIDEISTSLSNIDLSNIATKDEIPSIDGLARKDWVESKGYITSSALSRYAKKSDIPALDRYATQDWVNEQGFLTEAQDLSGLVKKTDLKDYVKTTSLNNYAKKSDLPTDYVKESDLSEYVKTSEISSALNDYAKKSSLSEYVKTSTFNNKLNNLATKSDIPDVSNFITKDDVPTLSGYATQTWVEGKGYITSSALSKYAKSSDIPDVSRFITKDDIPSITGYATKEWVENKGYITSSALSRYAKSSDIPDVSEFMKKDEISLDDYALKEWVVSQNYLKTHQSLAAYAKKSDIPTLDGYATQEWVNEQGFLTESQDLSGFAKKTDLKDYVKTTSLNNTLNNYAKKSTVYTKNESDSKFLSKLDASDIYLTKTSAADQFASKQMVEIEYLKIEDYRGLKDATVINDEYKNKSLEALNGDLNKLMNGFYIVDYNDIVVVKDHNVVNIFQDGTPHAVIEWREE